MVDKNSLKEAKRKKIIDAKKSMELQSAENKIDDSDITLTAAEEQKILEVAESDEEAQEMRESAIKALKQVEAVKLAKKQVNSSVPSKHLLQRPSYGHFSATALLHSHEAYRFLLGRNQRIIFNDEGKRIRQTSIVGLFEAASNVANIVAGYQSGCPYAAWTLVKIEDQLKLVRDRFHEAKNDAEKLCTSATLINMGEFTSRNPSEIPLNFKSVYGYHFADLLSQYDVLLRSILTYKIQHFISIDEYKAIERKMGRPLRQLYRLTDEWQFVGMDAVKEKNAKFQDAEFRMGVLPKEIISGEKVPKFVVKQQGSDDE
ncbi:MAG: DUF1845 family protein [Gammaproteobacteria bacterium]|nr:DUF1845 family protein [Gammaproteobacteria bacterium]